MSVIEFELATAGAALPAVAAALHEPPAEAGRPAVLLAHGAGVPMDAPFIVHVATGLARHGYPVLRFNYAYAERMRREGRRRPPERRPALELVHRAALGWLAERFPERPLVLAGKSLGGRISSYLAAEGAGTALVFYGYPLHPAGQSQRTRSEHFPAIAQPALFLQGTRDALCELKLLERALETFGGEPTLSRIEEADHDFAVPKRTGRTRQEVLDDLVARSAEWLGRRFEPAR